MVQVAVRNQARTGCVAGRLGKVGPVVSGMPYTLCAEAESSDAYHCTIAAFADEWLLDMRGLLEDVVCGFQLSQQRGGATRRSFAECAFEFLAVGVLLRERGREAASLPRGLARLAAGLVALQRRFVWAEGAIKPLRGFLLSIGQLARRRHAGGVGLAPLIAWLRAHAEGAQADRLSEWQVYLDELGDRRSHEVLALCLAMAEDFAVDSVSRLGAYTQGVRQFVEEVSAVRRWRYDRALVQSSRLAYHLGMMGTEILSRAYRDRFLSCERRVVVVPDCLRSQQNGHCKAVRTDLGGECRRCTPDCRVHQIAGVGEEQGFEVYILPDELRDFGVRACSSAGTMGVVGVSCALTNWHGGWQLQAAGVPAQGVLLDYAGCKRHWDERGRPTDVNLTELQRVVGRTPPSL